MVKRKIQLRVGILILVLSGLGLAGLFADRMLFRGLSFADVAQDPSFAILAFSLVVFGWCTVDNSPRGRVLLSLGVFGLSAPLLVLNGSENYYGLALIVLGVLLFHRFGLLRARFLTKMAAIIVWCVVWILAANQVSSHGSLAVSLNTIIFLSVNLLMLYFLFESEIRALLAANRTKDRQLAQQAAEIARLEPLSVLGERVSHVVHSFRNNLNALSTALYYLEQAHDPEKATQKLKEFNRTLNERIDNILMVSRAGVDLNPEPFDVGRLLEGLRDVYLQERTFLERARTELVIDGPELVTAVRWDFILLVENILKNALEAIVEKGGYGLIRLHLGQGKLTISNDGAPMASCQACTDHCLDCPQWGRPGQTTKDAGTGHGLSQVFATCRANHWGLRILAEPSQTSFEITFSPSVR